MTFSPPRPLGRAVFAVMVVAAALTVVAPAPAPATPTPSQPRWAAAEVATVHPGVQTITAGAQCTSNFVLYRPTKTGFDVYIGQAAHCSGLDTNDPAESGCAEPSRPLGTAVTIQGASRRGVMVYNSWLTMKRLKEEDEVVCYNNDFALIRVDPEDVPDVNPSVPVWGGPTALSEGFLGPNEDVFTYGNSMLRLGIAALSPKRGLTFADEEDGWSHQFYTATPGVFGDSGSAVLDKDGAAVGVLATIQIAPFAASNGAGDMRLELEYLLRHEPAFAGLKLALGTEPFNPNATPIG